jgi:hypothetical protein
MDNKCVLVGICTELMKKRYGRIKRSSKKERRIVMDKGMIIVIFTIIWGIIWLPCALWEKATEDERIDRFYKRLEK